MNSRLFVGVSAGIDAAVEALPRDHRLEWLQRVITEAAERELMGKEGKT
nr:hypothetical protein [Petrachloros mirabilis]